MTNFKKTWSKVHTNLKREKVLTLSNLAIMTLTFLLFGCFVTLVVASRTALQFLEEQAQVTVFFKDDFNESNILELKSQIEQDTRVASVSYISKEEAFRIFTELSKDQPLLLESISANILPASLEVKSIELYQLSDLAAEYRQIDGVEEVKYFEEVVENFRRISSATGGILLVVVMLGVSYSVIIATLRATINSKGTELSIMKLVGASDSYVRSPLVFQGVFFGVASSMAASLILLTAVLISSKFNLIGIPRAINHLNLVGGINVGFGIFLLILVLLLVVSGTLLGYLGSWTAVKRYLRY